MSLQCLKNEFPKERRYAQLVLCLQEKWAKTYFGFYVGGSIPAQTLYRILYHVTILYRYL